MKITAHNGRHIINHEGDTLLNFSTTAYLNLAYETEFQRFFMEGIKTFGHTYGSSPLSTPQLEVYGALENFFTSYYDAEACVLFSNGFSASQAVMNCFAKQGFCIEYGNVSHPALSVEVKSQGFNSVFATDMVDPIKVEVVEVNTPQNSQQIVIDASHGFGLLDSQIKQYTSNGFIVCGSINKGLSTPAGIVLCSQKLKEQLITLTSYSTSSPPSPAACYALLKAFETGLVGIQQQTLEQLLQLISPSNKYKHHHSLPFLRFHDERETVFTHFKKQGVLIWRNEYPKNTGKLLNRAVIHAGLEEADIELLLSLTD